MQEEQLKQHEAQYDSADSEDEAVRLKSRLIRVQQDLQDARDELRRQRELFGDYAKRLAKHEHVEEELREDLLSAEHTIVQQRQKVSQLLMENERLGAELESLASLERRLLHISSNPHAALAELLAWQHLGQSRLAPSIEVANQQLEVLWKYVREMGSPGHRLVSFIGRSLGRTFIGKMLRRLLHMLFALVKSR